MRTLIALLTITICAGAGRAQVVEIAGEVTIPGGGSQEFSFIAPEVPEGQIPVLHFLGRLANERQAGHSPGVRVFVNGTELDGKALVNKPQDLEWGGGRVTPWWSRGFRLMYSPDFEGNDRADNPYYISSGQAYIFDLDLSGVLQPGENTLRLAHAQADANFPRAAIVADLRVTVQAPPEGETAHPGPPTGPLPFIAPAADYRVDFTATCTPGGGVSVTIGGHTWAFDSEFSHERGGWNVLSGAGAATGEDRWTPQVGMLEGGFTVRATAADYAVERRVRVFDEYVSVEDTVTNTSGRDLALLQRHTTDAAEITDLYLCGLRPPSRTGTQYQPSNPTVLMVRPGSQVAVTPYDDVLRVHAQMLCLDGRGGLRDNDGALAAGATGVYRWEIYPRVGGGYYAMVNAIRRAHEVNFPIPGGFCFIDPREPFLSMSDQELRAWLDAKNASIVSMSISYPKYQGLMTHGSAFLRVDHTIKREFAERLRRIKPGIKVLVYFHSFISTEAEAPELFPDARILAPDGTGRLYDEGREYLRMFFPTANNSYGAAMREYVRIILEEIGADGVYWDEMSQSRWTWHYGEPWDGVSADVDDDTLTIARRKTSVALVTQPFRLPLAREILDRAVLVGNSAPYTASMAQLHFPRFVETAAVSNLRRGHLYTPIGLGDHLSERTTRDCVNAMRRHLTWGSLYYFYHQRIAMDYPSIAAQMFPCTPLELHPGYILCEERILTNTSGNFGWGDASEFAVHVYGADGREVPDFAAPVVEHEGGRYVELRLPRDYMAAIVREQ